MSHAERLRRGNLAQRVATAAVAVPILLYLLFWGPAWGFPLLLAAATAATAREMMAMTLPARPLQQAWGLAASVALWAAAAFASQAWLLTALMGLTLGALAVSLVHPEPIAQAGTRMAWSLTGPMYVALPMAALARLFAMPQGGAWVLSAMLFAWLSDTAAYFVGRALGRHKLSRLSPGKTLEGAAGGLAGSVLGGAMVQSWLLEGVALSHVLVLAVVAGAAGQLGDLVESLVKRSTQVKDSGTLLPGHGGLLDRIDALMFTSVVTWVYASWFAA